MRNPKVELEDDNEDPEVQDAIGEDSEDDEVTDDRAELLLGAKDAREDLRANLQQQRQYQMTLRNIEHWHDMPERIQAMANETQSPALASMIHDMLADAQMFAKPVYEEYIKEKLAGLEADEPDLKAMFHLSASEVRDAKDA